MESVRECVVNSSRALECVRERRGEREQAGSGWFGSRSSVKQAPAVSQRSYLRIAAQFRFHAFKQTPTS